MKITNLADFIHSEEKIEPRERDLPKAGDKFHDILVYSVNKRLNTFEVIQKLGTRIHSNIYLIKQKIDSYLGGFIRVDGGLVYECIDEFGRVPSGEEHHKRNSFLNRYNTN